MDPRNDVHCPHIDCGFLERSQTLSIGDTAAVPPSLLLQSLILWPSQLPGVSSTGITKPLGVGLTFVTLPAD